MGSVLLEQIKKQTSSFLQEKYKSARMTFTDVTEAEILAEKATNKDECSPDARTMIKIAEASFDVDDYWRVVDVLHKRLYCVDWEQWRQSYKALVLLEFLLTHGPEEFAQTFRSHAEIIEELGNFTHIDQRGFDWGARMQTLSDHILKLLESGETLRDARLKALKITNEIQGFGSSVLKSPLSSSSSSSSSSEASSFGSFSSTTTPTFFDSRDQLHKFQSQEGMGDQSNVIVFPSKNGMHVDKSHIWDDGEEDDVFIDSEDNENLEKPKGFVSGICSKIIGGSREKIEFRCISDVGRIGTTHKKFDRQRSFWFLS